MKDLFQYIGPEDTSVGYQPGKIYMLEINGYRRPYIITPYKKEYKTWELFFTEWQRVSGVEVKI